MKKVKLYVNKDMTVIDLGQPNTYANFHSFDRDEVIANVVKIVERDSAGTIMYDIYTDFKNPYKDVCSVFNLNEENFKKINWVN